VSLSAKELLKWLELAAVYLAGTSLLETAGQRRVMLIWLIGAALSQAFVGLAQSALRLGPPGFMIGGVLMRAYGTFEQPNPFAGYLFGGRFPAGSLSLFDSKVDVDDHATYGGRLGWNITRKFELEAQFSRTETAFVTPGSHELFGTSGQRLGDLTIDYLLGYGTFNFGRGRAVPYVTFGMGAARLEAEIPSGGQALQDLFRFPAGHGRPAGSRERGGHEVDRPPLDPERAAGEQLRVRQERLRPSVDRGDHFRAELSLVPVPFRAQPPDLA